MINRYGILFFMVLALLTATVFLEPGEAKRAPGTMATRKSNGSELSSRNGSAPQTQRDGRASPQKRQKPIEPGKAPKPGTEITDLASVKRDKSTVANLDQEQDDPDLPSKKF